MGSISLWESSLWEEEEIPVCQQWKLYAEVQWLDALMGDPRSQLPDSVLVVRRAGAESLGETLLKKSDAAL